MNSKTILLVDDELVIRNSLTMAMTNASSGCYQITTAANGEEAKTKLQSGFWNLVITDLRMPGIGGLEVLKIAKQTNPLTQVIILTGYANLDDAIDALRLGADDFLQKPCDIDELLIRISHCLVKQELMTKVRAYENILPVCCYCKKIRDERPGDGGSEHWYSLEEYMHRVQGIDISHGCCPQCFAEHINH